MSFVERSQPTDQGRNGRQLTKTPPLLAHEVVEEWARLTPCAVAVEGIDECLSYAELNEQAERLANRIFAQIGEIPPSRRRAGTIPLIGVYQSRSPRVVVSLLAILKSGAAFLPIDPALPAARREFMIRDAGLRTIVTERDMLSTIEDFDGEVLLADSAIQEEAIQGDPSYGLSRSQFERKSDSVSTAASVAYAIYTSGTTGRPKAALLSHGGLANLMRAVRWDSSSRLMQFSPIGFDASVLDIFTTLGSGATLCVANDVQLAPGPALAKTLHERKVSVVLLPPSILATIGAVELPHLETLIVGGETCSQKLAELWAPRCQMLNAYGPTECSVCSTIYEIPRYGGTTGDFGTGDSAETNAGCSSSRPPIGRPIEGCHVRIMDEHAVEVECGQAGELWIGGIGVGLGYLGRDELTREKFVELEGWTPEVGAERFCSEDDRDDDRRQTNAARESRLYYRSGDLVRQLPTGDIEFLGRIDQQVKVNGVRIELEEIVAELEALPSVDRAAVVDVFIDVFIEEVAGDSARDERVRLEAFVVPAAGGSTILDESSLRKQLLRSGILPQSMIPAVFHFVAALPHTPNGKLDREQLRRMADEFTHRIGDGKPQGNMESSSTLTKTNSTSLASGAVEFALLDIWQRVFSRRVVLNDDFFELGGDSLQVLSMLVEVERQFGIEFTVSQFMQGSTVRGLAKSICQTMQPRRWSPLVPLRSQGNKAPFYCVHPGGGNPLCYLPLAQELDDDRPFYALQCPGIDGVRAPLESVEEMASEYLAAIHELRAGTNDPPGSAESTGEEPIHLGGWSFGGIVAYEMAVQLQEAGQRVGSLSIIDSGFLYSFAVLRSFIESPIPIFMMSSMEDQAVEQLFSSECFRGKLVPDGADKATVQRIGRLVIQSAESTFRYRPRRYNGDLTLFRAFKDEIDVRYRRTPREEWQALCDGSVEEVLLPGTHMTMIRPPHVAELATALHSRLS